MWYVVTFIAGAFFGVLIMALCVASGRNDRDK
jgi:hypothetical protein